MKKGLAITLIVGSLAPFALGAVRFDASEADFSRAPSSVASHPAPAASSRFARFRPVDKYEDWDEAERILSQKSLNEQVFDKNMSDRMKDRYYGTVAPVEREAHNPFRRANAWEVERYEQSRKDLAQWTMKEVGRDQLKDFLRRSRKNSEFIDLVAGNTGHDEEVVAASPAAPARPLSQRERLALHQAPPPSREEPSVPTKLRAKVNVLKARGQLTFTNPVVSTSVDAKAGSGENLAVELNRDFRALELNSKVRYGVQESLFTVNVNKKITDEVSVDLNSERWTGGKRSAAGEKKKETAKMLYSVSF